MKETCPNCTGTITAHASKIDRVRANHQANCPARTPRPKKEEPDAE